MYGTKANGHKQNQTRVSDWFPPEAALALCGFNILKLSAVAALPLMRQAIQ